MTFTVVFEPTTAEKAAEVREALDRAAAALAEVKK